MADMHTPPWALLATQHADTSAAGPLRLRVGGWGRRSLYRVWADGTTTFVGRMADRVVAAQVVAAVNEAADRAAGLGERIWDGGR